MERTHIEIPNWHKITPQSATFFFAESEKRLTQSMQVFDSHRDKAFKILSIALPVFTLVIGFLTSHDQYAEPHKFVPALAVSIALFFGIAFLVLVIIPRSVQPIGSLPSSLIKAEMIIEDNDSLQIVALLLNLCENYEDRILTNLKTNTRSAIFLTWSTVFIGIVAPLAYFTALFFL